MVELAYSSRLVKRFLSKWNEIVTLTLRDVVYRNTDLPLLEDLLVEKYGFRVVSDKKQELYELRDVFQMDREGVVFKEEADAYILTEEVERKYSLLKVLEGIFSEAKISIYIMGDVLCKEDIVDVGEGEWHRIYTATYQMIKLVSISGYAMQQLIERLKTDVGLKIGSTEWSFYRHTEA